MLIHSGRGASPFEAHLRALARQGAGEIVTNIRRADVTRDQGWVLLEVSGEPEELDRGVEYLESRGVKVEPAEGDLVE